MQSKSVGLTSAEAFRGWAVPRAIDVQLESGESPNPGGEDLDRPGFVMRSRRRARRLALAELTQARLGLARLAWVLPGNPSLRHTNTGITLSGSFTLGILKAIRDT